MALLLTRMLLSPVLPADVAVVIVTVSPLPPPCGRLYPVLPIFMAFSVFWKDWLAVYPTTGSTVLPFIVIRSKDALQEVILIFPIVAITLFTLLFVGIFKEPIVAFVIDAFVIIAFVKSELAAVTDVE